jgi:hypothetical protein
MFKGHVWARFVVFCASVHFATSIASGQQDDLFGNPGSEAAEAAEDPFAPGRPPANEKPVTPLDPQLPVPLPVIEEAKDEDFCRCVGESDAGAVDRIEKILDSPLKANGLEFTETPLEQVLNLIQDEYGIPIQVDEQALKAIGLDSGEGLTVSLHNISLRSALRLMLKKLQLTHIIQGEVLLITSPEEAESQLLTCVYDVRNLLNKRQTPMGASIPDFDPLVSAIESCIATDTWNNNGGGEADMRPLDPGFLVIAQTRAVHDEISSLLTAIREMRAKNVSPADQANAAPWSEANEVIARSFILQVGQEGDAEKLRSQLREFIQQSLPEEQWDGRLENGQAAMLMIFSDRIVVRNKPLVVERLQQLLIETAIATPATSTDSNMGRVSDGRASGGTGGFGGTQGGGGLFAPHIEQPRPTEPAR